MSHAQPPSQSVTVSLELSAADWQLSTKVTVPTAPIPVRQMLPMVQSLADAVVDGAAQAAEAQGAKISCKKGCGACCRQLVPISEVEARDIRDLIENLPEPRRSQVRARFADARRQLEQEGMLDQLLRPGEWAIKDNAAFGLHYFYLGIPCPFLDEESCSIYPDRPLTCREFLVTNPAEHCSHPTPGTIRRVKMPFPIWTAFARTGSEAPAGRVVPWVPLIVAPEWAGAHPQEPPPKPGRELLRELFTHITGKDLTQPPPSFDPAEAVLK